MEKTILENLAARLGRAWNNNQSSLLLDQAARELIHLRSMDHKGALAIIKREQICQAPPCEKETQKKYFLEQAKLLTRLAQEKACLGCGTCCRTSSPTLYAKDLAIVETLPKNSLYTLRAGERVFSARTQKGMILEEDLIKIREQKGACVFLNLDFKCTIHPNHPLQCRHLKCWGNKNAADLKNLPRLKRQNLYADNQPALEIISEFDLKIPARKLDRLLIGASRDKNQTQADSALELMELDHRLRHGISQKFRFNQDELFLLLGRPAISLPPLYGLKLKMLPDGRAALLPLGGA
jgi:Fe-S-cluster containining protein